MAILRKFTDARTDFNEVTPIYHRRIIFCECIMLVKVVKVMAPFVRARFLQLFRQAMARTGQLIRATTVYPFRRYYCRAFNPSGSRVRKSDKDCCVQQFINVSFVRVLHFPLSIIPPFLSSFSALI